MCISTKFSLQTARHAIPAPKAHAGAYLNRQLEQLENKVREINIERGIPNRPATPEEDDYDFPRLGAKQQPKTKTAVAPPTHAALDVKPSGRIDNSDKGSARGQPVQNGRREHAESKNKVLQRSYSRDELDVEADDHPAGDRPWKVVVLDTSALLWAPQGVRRLVRQGWEVIVPVEGEFRSNKTCAVIDVSSENPRSAQVWVDTVGSSCEIRDPLHRALEPAPLPHLHRPIHRNPIFDGIQARSRVAVAT